jgi:penicillin-binding protein 2
LARLFQVQVLDDRYEAFAEQNVLSKRVDYPSRGLMYDRDGRLLVSNEAIYDLMIVPSKAREADARALARLLGISAEEYRERFSEAAAYSQVKPSVFYKQLSKSRYGRFQEQMFRFPGFFVQVRTKRQYHYAIAPHVLGYLGEVNRREMERDEYYGLGDYRGKAGLELAYEEALRGQKGVRHILVDVFNREQGTYEDGEMDIPPQAGYDLQLTLDAELQAYGERLMQNKRGAVVAIEPKTGEVLSMVSSPSYDPRRLTGRQRGKEYRKLVRDTFNIPMLNRAVSSQYPPGSTVKPLQALVAMEDSVIVPSTHFGCRLGYHIRGLSVGCHSHPSPLDVRGSIQHSCNAYYCHVFQKYLSPSRFGSTDSAFNRWREQVQGFGFGQRLGLDLPNVDKAGGIPPASLYNNIYGKGRWRASTIISLAIGQGEFQASVAQLANYTATIANRGYYITPHLVSEIGPRPKTRGIDTFQAPVARRHFIPVVEGMYAVVDRGTARFYGKVPDMNICGKTGTSQNPHGEDHSVFVAFAPKDDPQIAIAALVENAGYGGTWAAPISTMMIEQYLNGKIHPKRKWIEKRVLEGDFIKRPEEESADSTQTASLTDAE